MPALPRPDLPPGAHQDLVDALHDLHQRAGWPSLRRLANAAGCSHTTVSTVFSSPRLPSWGLVEVLVEELGGDVEEFQRLWLSIASGDAGWSSQRQVEIAGRRDQLAEVRRHLQSGDGLLVVVGEAGIGKTRLTSIAATRVTRSTVGRGACFPLSSATPLLPVITALLDLRGQAPAAWSEAVAAAPRWAMAPVARLIPDIAEDAPADDNDPWAHQRLLLGLSTLLDELHARAPVALLLEDLHWADTTTLEFLEQLLAARHRVPFVATWRSEDPSVAGVNTDWLHRVERVPGSSVLALGLLSEQETREQLVLLTGGEPTPALLRDVYERGRGQPLFTEQLVQPGGDGAAFPRLLADLLGARLADVSGAPWELCGTLAVVDRPVAETLLGSVTGLSPAVLVGALHELRDRALLDTGTEVVALRHPLLGEAISRRLTAMERTDLHRRVAEALSRAPDPDPAEVASHWSSVGDQVRELAWRVRAAQQADVRLAPAGAARQWLRVHELWPSDNEAAASLAVTWGEAFSAMLDALDRSAQVAVAVGFVRDALSLIDQLAPADAADVLTHAGDYIGFLDGPEAGLVHLDRAVELRNGQSPTLGTVRTFEIRAFRLQRLGRHAEARRDLETAVRTSEEINALGWHRTLRAELVGPSTSTAWPTAQQSGSRRSSDSGSTTRTRSTTSPWPASSPTSSSWRGHTRTRSRRRRAPRWS